MIKNRTAQLIYQTVYCTLGLVGIIASMGIFDDISNFRWDFYVHLTNLSNFLGMGVMVAALIQTARKKENSYVTAAPLLKFIGMVSILLNFLVFNFMLAGAEGRDPQLNWRIGSLCFHVVLPIMYIADWFLFYERKTAKWYYPMASISFPLAYTIFIYIQAAVLRFDTSILIPNSTTPLIYPYFFLNLETLGVVGVLKWIFLVFIVLMSIGYIFLALNHLGKRKNTEGK